MPAGSELCWPCVASCFRSSSQVAGSGLKNSECAQAIIAGSHAEGSARDPRHLLHESQRVLDGNRTTDGAKKHFVCSLGAAPSRSWNVARAGSGARNDSTRLEGTLSPRYCAVRSSCGRSKRSMTSISSSVVAGRNMRPSGSFTAVNTETPPPGQGSQQDIHCRTCGDSAANDRASDRSNLKSPITIHQ